MTDQDTGNRFSLVGSELTISGATISIASEQLRKNRHYIINVSANNAYGSALSHIMLSEYYFTLIGNHHKLLISGSL